MARNREVEQLVAVAVSKGWRTRKGGHGQILMCPGGCCRTSVSSTPGGYRYAANLAAILRRCKTWR